MKRFLVILCLIVAGCSGGNNTDTSSNDVGSASISEGGAANSTDTTPKYDTQIRWTSYGIPHVKAEDWGSLGYGFAYATATDGVCVIARDVMMVNGELSRYLGPDKGNLESDVFYKSALTDSLSKDFLFV